VARGAIRLKPLRRFQFDAANLFSDILVVPFALGQQVSFAVGEGPQLEPIKDRIGFERLAIEIDHDVLAPIYETVALVKDRLDSRARIVRKKCYIWLRVTCYAVCPNRRGGPVRWVTTAAPQTRSLRSRQWPLERI
jgi:hypothetical protein